MKMIMPTKIAISLAFAYPESIELPRPIAIMQNDTHRPRLPSATAVAARLRALREASAPPPASSASQSPEPAQP